MTLCEIVQVQHSQSMRDVSLATRFAPRATTFVPPNVRGYASHHRRPFGYGVPGATPGFIVILITRNVDQHASAGTWVYSIASNPAFPFSDTFGMQPHIP